MSRTNNGPIEQVAAKSTSGHFYGFISEFPAQRHNDREAQNQSTLAILQKEFYSTDDSPYKRVCYRDCFKQPIRKYVEFCLEKRCNNANFEDAAKFMGYLK